MADATTKVKTLPTNAQWQHCGPPDPQVKELLAKLNKTSKKSRIEWLKDLCMTPLPSGPYPFHIGSRGWFKGHIYDERYQACYVIRKDLNLDVRIFKVNRGPSGRIVERVLVKDSEQRMRIRVCKVDLWRTFAALYPKESAKITVVWEMAEVTVATMVALIAREVELWNEYDAETMESRKLMKQVQQGPAQCELICRGHADDDVLLKAMQKDAKVAQSRSKPRRAKRCLPFTEKFGPEVDEHPLCKRPKVRFVSKLDKADAALNAVNKQVGSTLWVMKKLGDEKVFRKSLSKKAKKIAGAMFKLLPREDLLNIAVKLAQNCALDALEEVLQGYRSVALNAAQKKYNEHVRQSIVANNNLAQLQKEVDNEELGENAADAIPIMDDSPEEPLKVEPLKVGPLKVGPPEVGPPEVVSQEVGPQEDGPQEDGPEAMTTPGAVAREHWITSARSSTGYKGVSLEKGSTRFRVKHGGNTIARRNTIEEACSFYYNWSVRNGMIKDFRLV